MKNKKWLYTIADEMGREKFSVWYGAFIFSLVISVVISSGVFYVLSNTMYTKDIYYSEIYWEELKHLDFKSEEPFVEFNPHRFRFGKTYPDFYFAFPKTATENKETVVQSLEKNHWKELQDGILVKTVKDKVIYLNIQEKKGKVEVFMTSKL